MPPNFQGTLYFSNPFPQSRNQFETSCSVFPETHSLLLASAGPFAWADSRTFSFQLLLACVDLTCQLLSWAETQLLRAGKTLKGRTVCGRPVKSKRLVGPESPALAKLGHFLSVTCQYRITVHCGTFYRCVLVQMIRHMWGHRLQSSCYCPAEQWRLEKNVDWRGGMGGDLYLTLEIFFILMPLSSICSFQQSAGVAAHMLRAVAITTSLTAHTVLLGAWCCLWHLLTGRHTSLWPASICRLPCFLRHLSSDLIAWLLHPVKTPYCVFSVVRSRTQRLFHSYASHTCSRVSVVC